MLPLSYARPFADNRVGGAQAVGAVLRARLGPAARRVPTWPMPDFVIWLGSFFSPTMALLYPQLGVVRNASGEKAKCVGCQWGTWVSKSTDCRLSDTPEASSGLSC